MSWLRRPVECRNVAGDRDANANQRSPRAPSSDCVRGLATCSCHLESGHPPVNCRPRKAHSGRVGQSPACLDPARIDVRIGLRLAAAKADSGKRGQTVKNDVQWTLAAACIALLASTAPAIAAQVKAENFTGFVAAGRATDVVSLAPMSARAVAANRTGGQGADRGCGPDRRGPSCGASGDEKGSQKAVAVSDPGATLPLLGTAVAGVLLLRRRWR